MTPYWKDYLQNTAWHELVTKAREILKDHPINQKRIKDGKIPVTGIWPWGEGKLPSMPTIPDRFGISGTMVSAVDLLKGLGVCAELSVAQVVGATGYIDTNYAGKAQAAIDALKNQDLVFVHLEGPDEAGHQARVDHKIQAIEDFDAKIVGPITRALRDSKEVFRAVITMDHFTPVALQTHTSEPVPVILYDSREDSQGSGLTFDERPLARGDNLDLVDGYKLINLLLQLPQEA